MMDLPSEMVMGKYITDVSGLAEFLDDAFRELSRLPRHQQLGFRNAGAITITQFDSFEETDSLTVTVRIPLPHLERAGVTIEDVEETVSMMCSGSLKIHVKLMSPAKSLEQARKYGNEPIVITESES